MNKIKVNDKVIIVCGKDKGKIGIVSKVLKIRSDKLKVIVEGLNLFKKHTRGNPNKNKSGGILSISKPIDFSNVSLFCDVESKKSKVFFSSNENLKKHRYFKLNKEVVN